jgi:hypothetical protein
MHQLEIPALQMEVYRFIAAKIFEPNCVFSSQLLKLAQLLNISIFQIGESMNQL